MEPITSYRGEFDFLSNFFIEPDGTCVEVEFQAFKGLSVEEMHWVMDSYIDYAKTPAHTSKKRGRNVEIVNDGWDAWLAQHAMRFFVLKKFLDHDELAQKLMATGGRPLIEGNTHGDTTWGCVWRNGEWVGKNQLGQIHEAVRDTLIRNR